MGQNNSRHRAVRSTPQVPQSVVPPQSEAIPRDDPSTSDAQPSEDIATTSQPSGRSSKRHSLKTLISTKPWSTTRSRVDSSTSQPDSQSSRRRWRTSRRFSKAPQEVSGQPQEAVASVPESASEGLDAPVASSSTNPEEREDVDVDITPVDRPATPSGPVSEVVTPDIGPTEDEQGTSSDIQEPLAQYLGLPNLEDDEVVISPSAFLEEQDDNTGADVTSEATNEMQIPTHPVQDGQAPIPTPLPLPPVPVSDAQPSRQFPPPGTLVVVQGVVHTTDVSHPPAPPTTPATLSPPNPIPSTMSSNPRRASSYIPRPSTPVRSEGGFPRSRRASVLPRPSSMRARPFSMVEGSSVASSIAENNSDSEPIDGESTLASSGSGSDASTPVSSQSGTPALSPSSIDVLGTLLSVAAAATAASLLTGSSDPIFTPGLSSSSLPNAAVPQPHANTTNSFDRPASPTPTAGLGNFNSLSAGLGLGAAETAAPQTHGSGRERVRHAWGSLRERLGWRVSSNGNSNIGAGTGSGNQQPNINSRTRPDGTPMDAREVMLAEMARAFNLGLGLGSTGPTPDTGAGEGNSGQQENGNSPTDTSPASPNAQRLPEVPLPAEGSFERFLVDLQADLRATLSAPDPPPNQLPYTQRSDPESGIPEIRLPQTSTTPATAIDQDAQSLADDDAELPGLEYLSPPPPTFSSTAQDSQVDGDQDSLSSPQALRSTSSPRQDSGVEADQESTEIGPRPSLPAFPSTTTRSDSESVTADGDVPEMSETPHVTPSGPGAVVESGPTSRTERRPGGGINWWRSYRFPPITTPHAHGAASSTNLPTSPLATTPPTGPPSETSTTPPSPSHIAPSNPIPQAPEPGASSPPAETRPNIVIPVIVVGLQSVNMDRGRDQALPFGNNDGTFGANHNEPESSGLGGDANFDSMADDGDTGAQPHGRTWHSRAANVLRNLRPGRRASRAAQTNDGVGSRTFLIYVIGGYYPPDHSLITGANALDSFEALWELAELLGQVKPQTVSKDEIDNSGLEIIKPTALEEYEKDGKVASNCLERCLICLDDYVPEADLRLLSCKHAFHKSCVDQWLQTGKNNCPACRTTGVSTGPESIPASPVTSPS